MTAEASGSQDDGQRVAEILRSHSGEPTRLVEALQDIQAALRWLPREALEQTAEALGVPLSRVCAVATFYAAFTLVPKGETVVRLCKGTACHIRGAEQLADLISAATGIGPGETRDDLKYTFETVSCLGACAMAPVLVINDKVHGTVRPGRIKKLLKEG
jgi:NADH-quinone oxidoreductase subunit E